MRSRWISLVAGCALLMAPLGLIGCGNNGPPDFVLSLNTDQAAEISIPQGGTANLSFQVAALKGSSGSITLSVSGLPENVGIAPGVATVGIGSPQQFILTASTDAPLTTTAATLTATGISGNPLDSSSITHSQTVMLSVVAPATP